MTICYHVACLDLAQSQEIYSYMNSSFALDKKININCKKNGQNTKGQYFFTCHLHKFMNPLFN